MNGRGEASSCGDGAGMGDWGWRMGWRTASLEMQTWWRGLRMLWGVLEQEEESRGFVMARRVHVQLRVDTQYA